MRDTVVASIRAGGLENRMEILPYQEQWWGLLKTCTALIHISRFEGQPNVVLEAMAARCPLIVSNIPEHRAILDEKSALILPPEDPAAVARGIVSVLSDRDAARRRAEWAYKRVAGMTIDFVADQYEHVYEKVLRGTE